MGGPFLTLLVPGMLMGGGTGSTPTPPNPSVELEDMYRRRQEVGGLYDDGVVDGSYNRRQGVGGKTGGGYQV